MPFCTNCGQRIPDGANFCANCGAAVGVTKDDRSQRKTVFDGELHKCPQCGENLDAFVTTCPACGYELRGTKATSVVNELAKKLEVTTSAEQKKELIRNFYIPNTKEDIHEFFMLALSQVKVGGTLTDAWMVKLEQAYQKAELSFPGTQEFERLKILYEKVQKMNKKKSVQQFVKSMGKYLKSGFVWALLLFGIGSLFALIPAFWEVADGLRAVALIIAAVSLFGRIWRALDK